jgi:D-threonine aldolase
LKTKPLAIFHNILNINELDTPALVVFPDIVKKNIKTAIDMVGEVDRLRPHIKTHKTAEVIKMCQTEGVQKYKCATIAEAELLGMCEAEDVLLAYQPNGPKAKRLAKLITKYALTKYSCLLDDVTIAEELSDLGNAEKIVFSVYIDLNIGQNRTGIVPNQAINLIKQIQKLPNLAILGIHAYDGHIYEVDYETRKLKADDVYLIVNKIRSDANILLNDTLNLVMSGSPTFSVNANRSDVECSPGTFVFWDAGYTKYSEQAFKPAVVAITRITSKPNEHLICTDLGYKSIAAERPISDRIVFEGVDLLPISHSEEHLVLEILDQKQYQIGTILLGIPYHICPTIALYNHLNVVENDQLTGEKWVILARERSILI